MKKEKTKSISFRLPLSAIKELKTLVPESGTVAKYLELLVVKHINKSK